MDLSRKVSDWFSRLKIWKTEKGTQVGGSGVIVMEEHDITRALWRFEPYVVRIQSVLVWENPVTSVFYIIAVNVLFWLVVNFHWRFYGLLFTAALTVFVYDIWAQKFWPEMTRSFTEKTRNLQQPSSSSNPTVLSIPEISHYLSRARTLLKDHYICLKNMRDDQPGMFCCCTCVCFLILTVIGRTFPGSVIAYVVVMLIMIFPGIYLHLLPPSIVQKLRTFFVAFREKERETDSEEDYLPEQTGENLAVLQLAGEPIDDEPQDDSVVPEEFGLELETVDSSATQASFVTGINAMPSHDEGSTDGLDVSEFDLSAPPSQHGNGGNNAHAKRELDVEQSDTDEEDIAEIQFQSSHFNGNSSEEDEEVFTQGLSFSENIADKEGRITNVPNTTATTRLGEILSSSSVQSVARNIGAMGQSFISSVIGATMVTGTGSQAPQRPTQSHKHSSSSSDSDDFEIISKDDLS